MRGVADELLERIGDLDGLNPPHLIFGRTQAQAYDIPAYKCAADDLVLGAGSAGTITVSVGSYLVGDAYPLGFATGKLTGIFACVFRRNQSHQREEFVYPFLDPVSLPVQ